MIGSDRVVWAKRMIEGTHMRTAETRTAFNLKTKRLIMGWTEVTFNEINFVERGQRHLHVLAGIVKIDGFQVKFSFKETHKRRRCPDIVNAFVKSIVLGSLDFASLEIFAAYMLHGLLTSQEDPRTSMHINLGISRFGG